MTQNDIARLRMFVGAVVLGAAAITWGIGLMMSPHGEAVARGTEYLRGTILTFKHKGAIGTLALCAAAAWLLFPRRRSNWPARDVSLAVLLCLLAASSVYTLVSLRRPDSTAGGADQNFEAATSVPDMNSSSITTAATDNIPATTIESPPEALKPVIPTAGIDRTTYQAERQTRSEYVHQQETSTETTAEDVTQNRGGEDLDNVSSGNSPETNEN